MKKNAKVLVATLAQACHYAQDHINDLQAWGTEDRETLLQCTSHQIACFLAQNTEIGDEGVDSNIVLDSLVEHPMKTENEWKAIIQAKADELGGWTV